MIQKDGALNTEGTKALNRQVRHKVSNHDIGAWYCDSGRMRSDQGSALSCVQSTRALKVASDAVMALIQGLIHSLFAYVSPGPMENVKIVVRLSWMALGLKGTALWLRLLRKVKVRAW